MSLKKAWFAPGYTLKSCGTPAVSSAAWTAWGAAGDAGIELAVEAERRGPRVRQRVERRRRSVERNGRGDRQILADRPPDNAAAEAEAGDAVGVRTHPVLLLQEGAGSGGVVDVPLRIGGGEHARDLIGIGVVCPALARDQVGGHGREAGLGVAPRDVLVVLEQAAVLVNDHDARVRARRRRHGHVTQQR